MKNLIRHSVAAGSLIFLAGCATAYPIGGIFTDITLPAGATSAEANGAKSGVASCKSYFTLVATGDCSIEAAKRNGGISTVSHMDWKANNILGIVGTYELTVYGQ